jgi:hypothetical protein
MGGIEKTIHELFNKHIWTKWYNWSENHTSKRRHCKICYYSHNKVVPYQIEKGFSSLTPEQVGNDYHDLKGRIPFNVEN